MSSLWAPQKIEALLINPGARASSCFKKAYLFLYHIYSTYVRY